MRNKWTKSLFAVTEPVISRLTTATKMPPVFIVGNIRSGTTLVYQYLTGALNCCYFSNLERYYYKTPLSATYFFRAAAKFQFSDKSFFGEISGKYAPSDGWEIFNRFFSYYFNPLATRPLLPLKKIIQQTSGVYQQPFMVKNNANSLRVFELNALFEDALFIRVDRSPIANICSVLKGRKANQIPIGQFWAVGPEELPEKYRCQGELEEICFQYHIVQFFLDRFFQSLPSGRSLEVNYEAFCHSPSALPDELRGIYPGLLLRNRSSLPLSFTPMVPDQDTALTGEIEKALDETSDKAMDWVNSVMEQYYSQFTYGAG